MTDIPAGTYVVLDPAVRASIAELLRTAGTLLDTAAPQATGVTPAESDAAYTAADALLPPGTPIEHLDLPDLIRFVHGVAAAGAPELREQVDALSQSLAHARQSVAEGDAALEAMRAEHEKTRAVASRLETSLGRTQDQLAETSSALDAERARHDETCAKLATAEDDLTTARGNLEQSTTRIRELEADAAHTGRELEQARADLADAKAATPEPAPAKPLHGNSARGRDRKAWQALSARIEQQALTQPKNLADVLRITRKAIDDEITAIYGEPRKAAS